MTIKDFDLGDFEKVISKHGSGRKAALALGVPETTFRQAYTKARESIFTSRKIVNARKIEAASEPLYFIFTSAQDNTTVNKPFFDNLKTYAEYLRAEIMVAGYTYNKALFQSHSKHSGEFSSEVMPYLVGNRVEIGERLVFCGEMNTLPTAVNPLSGFHNYTGVKSGIFPHAKVHLESVATMKDDPIKVIMTTGSVTNANYVAKKAGIKAEFHHILGAVIVELTPDGEFFARHIIADETGAFYDLDAKIDNGEVSFGHRAEAITWGDIHLAKIDPIIASACWGDRVDFGEEWEGFNETCLFDRLEPKHQFFHDILDFEVRNHHNISDHLFRYRQMMRGYDRVQEEISEVSDFLNKVSETNCVNIIVESNHDLAFERWLKTADYKNDPVNAIFMLENILKLYHNAFDKDFSVFEDCVLAGLNGVAGGQTHFLRQDQSYKICEWDSGGIECGLHGHLGSNGSRPTYKQFAKLGPRVNSAHEHSAGIYEGVYKCGVTGELDMGYNIGPSSWNHSHVVTYANAKRAIVFMNSHGQYTTI